VHLFEGFPQPEQTPFFISRPHFMHGVHPHVWHIFQPFQFDLPVIPAQARIHSTLKQTYSFIVNASIRKKLIFNNIPNCRVGFYPTKLHRKNGGAEPQSY
jgi:hypothetical protein